MKDVETLIYSRMINDTVLVNLLGGDDANIKYAFQSGTPTVPQLTYFMFTAAPGEILGNHTRTYEELYQFNIFSNDHPDIAFRLKRLFDGMVFDVSPSVTELGAVSSVFDWEGPDGFDEALEVMRKDLRFRFFAVPKAQNPITT